MARKSVFDRIDEVAKDIEIKSEIIRIVNIPDEKLIDYPDNNEDVEYTEDLELSMKENGFTDPLEVTDYKMEQGSYMIISGHRRRRAARKVGYGSYPSIIRHFKNDKDFENYILMSNAYRNTEKDPLLYVKRYAMHEKYLDKIGFDGDKATEISKRLGMSRANALRYKQMNKVILPVWDMVRMEKVGMSNVLFMATYSEDEQKEIYKILVELLEKDISLNREKCHMVKEQYERKKAGLDEQIPGQENIETLDGGAYMPDDYVYDNQNDNEPAEPPMVETVMDETSASKKTGKSKENISPEKVKEEAFFHYLTKVDDYLTSDYKISDKEAAIKMVKDLKQIIMESIEEIKHIGKSYDMAKMTDEDLNDISHVLKDIMKNN